MIRRIIHIDEEKCTGCGACAQACHEGAIAMVNGKAKLVREDYCDGLGDCLPACPADAIRFEEREAPPYDAAAVQAARDAKCRTHAAGCPGSRPRVMTPPPAPAGASGVSMPSQLRTWPVQIKLVPPKAPWLDGADLLVAADCTAYAYASFHGDFIRGRVCLVGCPKLDRVDYSEKLTDILAENDVRSITVARMEVPCCGGLEYAVREAVKNSGKAVPLRVATIAVDGHLQPGDAD